MRAKTIVFALTMGLALLLTSCEEKNGGTIDSGGLPPQAGQAALLPDTVNVDTLAAVNDLYSISSIATVKASDPEGGLSRVSARILNLNSSTPFTEITLHDDGVSPDVSAGDSIYSGSLNFEILRGEAGPYRVQFSAIDNEMLQSSTIDLTLSTTRRNAAPSLDSASLDAPSLVTIPASGLIGAAMSIAATDSDGLADIREVFFLSPDGGNPEFRFPLKDDGGFDPSGPPSGDEVAGDGTYTILLIIEDSPTIRGDYRLFFQAEDSFGDTSDTVFHLLTIE